MGLRAAVKVWKPAGGGAYLASDDDKVAPTERVGCVLRLFIMPDIFRTRATIVKYWSFRAVRNCAKRDALADAERAVE